MKVITSEPIGHDWTENGNHHYTLATDDSRCEIQGLVTWWYVFGFRLHMQIDDVTWQASLRGQKRSLEEARVECERLLAKARAVVQ